MKEADNNDFFVRNYMDGDFDQIVHLWKLTDMGCQKRGDNNKTIEDSYSTTCGEKQQQLIDYGRVEN